MPVDISTVRVANLWCAEGKHDKLYRLELSESKGVYDVFSAYGRRGGTMRVHIWRSGVGKTEAEAVYWSLLREKYRKGYCLIQEDTMDVGESRPTRIS